MLTFTYPSPLDPLYNKFSYASPGDNLENIEFEKLLETIYDHVRSQLPCDRADRCPMLQELGDILIMIEEGNNERMALEIGLVRKAVWRCEVCDGK